MWPNDKLALCKTHLLGGQTKNARAANAFAALILIGCRHVKQVGLANENLRIHEDTISMPKLFCVELEILFQNFSSQNSDLNNNLTLCQAYSLFVALIAPFAPSLRSGTNDAARAQNKLYALQKSYDCPICYVILQ